MTTIVFIKKNSPNLIIEGTIILNQKLSKYVTLYDFRYLKNIINIIL